ncbi:SDR family oxidoreductase [Ralstonia solanacearum]|uniref:SDR family oxidoreductase n=1 Tax=Ralstonia solanacearum TaxID=305 RepID=UPI0006DBDFD7|nr:SDR family oxidoreductase [Ralstonia solanacearum]MCL9844286.1 SDR family oxidoreductase [Ralstonia solanacearum]MDC6256293.1 SDR family oxidoreductase [Ralstonia solanacearum]MDC6260881.1 SDR family oxidoreductase [Ralstonia solanacearum]MDC6303708.1 SDR family oxidoreductase [Ralstonia solanacearum]
MKMQDLTGKIAVVTGASSGIGEATTRMLVSEGAHVVLVARRRERIEALAKELGGRTTAFVADVGDASQVGALFVHVRETFGGLDLLLNNAGLGFNAAFVDSKPDQWRSVIDTNIIGMLSCTQAAIPLLKGRLGAMIASISSTGGRYGVEGWSVYCAIKYAVVGFHETLRKELGADGIRISVVEPGAVWTEFGHNVPEQTLRERREALDALHAEDVAQAIVYAFAQPPRALVQEILVRPVKQTSP